MCIVCSDWTSSSVRTKTGCDISTILAPCFVNARWCRRTEPSHHFRVEELLATAASAMELVIVGIALLVGILLFCIAGVIQEALGIRQVRSQLRAPLLLHDGAESANAIERRVELAVREARAGFRHCAQCEFTNPRRVTSCVVCGAVLPGCRQGELQQPSTTTLTSRQIRIRRRKEWVRQVTSDGRIEWGCPQTLPDDVATHRSVFAPFVLQVKAPFKPDQSDAAYSEPANENSTAVEPVLAQIVVVVPVETSAQVATTLQREAAEHQLVLVDALTVDPAQPAFVRRVSGQELKDRVIHSHLDFPTKLAEFITSTLAIFLKASTQEDALTHTVSRFQVHRSTLLLDSVDAIATMTPTQVRGAIRVDFKGEQGIDAGGVYREWFVLVNECLVRPDAGLFVCSDQSDQSFFMNRHSREILGDHHLAHFLVAGRLLGRALLEGNVTGFHLSLPLLKMILGLPVAFEDLEYLDAEVFKNLRWLLDNEGAATLGLDFTVTEILPSGETRVVELMPGGSQREVTDENKREYVALKTKYLLVESVASQLFAFLKGLFDVVPVELLMLFDAEELDYLLSGSDEIDVDDWERNTITSKTLVDHPALAGFWTSVRALSTDERQRLLQFATGATRVPPGGFSALTSYDGRLCRFTLKGIDPLRTRGYIRSHACFNRLDLPLHLDPRDMKHAIAAVLSSRSFGFTTA